MHVLVLHVFAFPLGSTYLINFCVMRFIYEQESEDIQA